MKSWKLVLGAGAACAACCAVPLVGGLAAWGVGTGAAAAIAAALAACPEAWVPFAAVLAGVAGFAVWRRRSARVASSGCGCASVGTDGPACGVGPR